MATAVKMDEDTKSKLEKLQAEIKLRTGEKVTQQELLERLVESAYASRTEFIDTFRDSASLSSDDVDAFNAGQIESSIETAEDDIDEILYGQVNPPGKGWLSAWTPTLTESGTGTTPFVVNIPLFKRTPTGAPPSAPVWFRRSFRPMFLATL